MKCNQSRIWTHVAVSNSCDDNHYTTGTSWKWCLILPFLTLSNISYISRVKWSNLGKGVAPFATPRCSSYWKGSFLVALEYGHQLITEKAVDDALKQAKEYIMTSKDKINIIRHYRILIPYHNQELWIKKDDGANIDIPIECLLLCNLNSIIDHCNYGLYRDDGLIIVDNRTFRKGDMISNKLHRLFNKFGFNLGI